MHMLVENSFILGLIFPYQTEDQHINNGIKKADVHHAQIIKNTHTHTSTHTHAHTHTHTHTHKTSSTYKLLLPGQNSPGSNNFLFL